MSDTSRSRKNTMCGMIQEMDSQKQKEQVQMWTECNLGALRFKFKCATVSRTSSGDTSS